MSMVINRLPAALLNTPVITTVSRVIITEGRAGDRHDHHDRGKGVG
jgi:hypothetical protein